MHLVKAFSVGSALSSVMDKLSFKNSSTEMRNENAVPSTTASGQGTSSTSTLRFHSVHGKAIQLYDDSTVAGRDKRYFEHSVIFSNRSVRVNENVAVEILETSTEFHGPLRIGFTSYNPTFFRNDVPLGRDLKSMQGVWIKSVQLFPINVGSVIYFKVDADGTILYGVDGENGGVFLKDVDVSQRLWVMLEAYGSVQALRFVDKCMTLVNLNTRDFDENDNARELHSPTRRILQAGRRVLQPMNRPLHSRRNVRLANLENVPDPIDHASPTRSPNTPAFASPVFSPGLCIICTDREKNTAFTKCGHLCMCYNCAEDYKNRAPQTQNGRKRKLCPVCRQPILSILRIYM